MSNLRRRPGVGVTGLVVAFAVTAACSSATAKGGGTAKVPNAPPMTSDPWAVPATITVPYVNRVLAELNHIDGNAVRSARAANAITPEFTQLEMSIRANDNEFQLVQTLWTKTMTDGWPNISLKPGDRVSTVISLLAATTACVSAHVSEDLQQQGPGGKPPPPWFIALVPKPVSYANPTHWAFIFDGFETASTVGGVPLNACAGD
jgi:hypothetical protein